MNNNLIFTSGDFRKINLSELRDNYCRFEFRIISIFYFIAENKLDLVESEIHNLKNFYHRNKKKTPWRKRYLLKLNLLIKLLKYNFDFLKVLRNSEAQLLLMNSEEDTECNWDPRDPEVIKFDNWLKHFADRQEREMQKLSKEVGQGA